ncbi:unnamed protein product [Protopolystoma xenopodis]|uniref:Uncharacterized protein n=1 Tax=Protopolystoma xenopodis TaxID=117903 RepID=A0A3S5CR42_9PLAT|nr:unnamed protein product [Protopolystoma xenopodis]
MAAKQTASLSRKTPSSPDCSRLKLLGKGNGKRDAKVTETPNAVSDVKKCIHVSSVASGIWCKHFNLLMLIAPALSSIDDEVKPILHALIGQTKLSQQPPNTHVVFSQESGKRYSLTTDKHSIHRQSTITEDNLNVRLGGRLCCSDNRETDV